MIMRAHHVVGVVAVVLLLAPVGKAQQPPAATTPQASPSRPPAKTPPPSAESLGVSLKSETPSDSAEGGGVFAGGRDGDAWGVVAAGGCCAFPTGARSSTTATTPTTW